MEKREHNLIQNITHFTFQLCRKTPNLYSEPNISSNIDPLSPLLNDILFSLKAYLLISDYQEEINKYLSLLIYLYKLIPYTRDIYLGKGERELTYLMITVWYKIFPKLAIYAIEMICSYPNIGSWKDAKYLCHYIKHHTTLLTETQKENLITHMIKYMNQSLYREVHSENKNKNQFSLIAKWIPREKSKFGWLYESLVKHWIETYETKTPTIITTHHYKIYRKIISNQNRSIDTTQIKQCERNSTELDYTKVSLVTKCRNSYYFLQNPTRKTNPNPNPNPNPKINYDLGELCHCTNFITDKQIEKNTEMWNKIRENLSPKKQEEYFFIPILNMNSNNLLDGIAISILLSEISCIENRIMIYDQTQTHWISLEKQHTLLEKISEIKKHTINIPTVSTNIWKTQQSKSQYNPDKIIPSLECIIQSILQTKLSPEKIEKMCIIILSDFSQNTNLQPIIKHIFYSNEIYKLPSIVYWNISNKLVPNLPCPANTPNVLFLAGASSSNFDYLLHAFENEHQQQTPFESFQKRINHEKYQPFETYIRKVNSYL